jgi:hypothetical protein
MTKIEGSNEEDETTVEGAEKTELNKLEKQKNMSGRKKRIQTEPRLHGQ